MDNECMILHSKYTDVVMLFLAMSTGHVLPSWNAFNFKGVSLPSYLCWDEILFLESLLCSSHCFKVFSSLDF